MLASNVLREIKQPVCAKRVEFDDVILDLTDLIFEQSEDDNDEHYIIFLNIKKAFYKHFYLKCNMSLETLTLYIFNNLTFISKQIKFVPPKNFVDYISFNADDNNNSMFIELCSDARVIVAKRLHSKETYHQRVCGFLDFQKRNFTPLPIIIEDQHVRDKMDRELENQLYQLN
ncbi:ac57 [Oxyplax ochracea nucleopolyhedrovirus]|uniref:Ac57 n=1 Tax=Oxyplax ochracea nucleopolyhedrovirus TaxID=2083176 RepID=A0A2L0WU49_9ABAC|nr:ac57 [Oxyplax ochracea nucleopolyhedrovirus]AVA31177.1 ac57 [Oxyplax ochracea nucleopolyhedrovirus]